MAIFVLSGQKQQGLNGASNPSSIVSSKITDPSAESTLLYTYTTPESGAPLQALSTPNDSDDRTSFSLELKSHPTLPETLINDPGDQITDPSSSRPSSFQFTPDTSSEPVTQPKCEMSKVLKPTQLLTGDLNFLSIFEIIREAHDKKNNDDCYTKRRKNGIKSKIKKEGKKTGHINECSTDTHTKTEKDNNKTNTMMYRSKRHELKERLNTVTLKLRGIKRKEREEILQRFDSEKPWKWHRDVNYITSREYTRYEGVWIVNSIPTSKFNSLKWNNGPEVGLKDGTMERVILSSTVKEIWSRSGLPQSILRDIYSLVDSTRNSTLQKREFVVGMWLVDQSLYGRRLPNVVDENVWLCADIGGQRLLQKEERSLYREKKKLLREEMKLVRRMEKRRVKKNRVVV